ncbi:proton-conducting transporter membrane subunit [Hyphomicrobium sp.]|uniref:proton-conducting transporter transmembrane domain-containing protein n=1 Tax=Hyphomicrobium sp. TaxID=82 RepID=UPI000FAD66E3|nr:proton-conducting transporter membrane subunit [Hyphomicrobium sp.]RUO99083.1 MAG: oxidoreductase [Hyphomicrobium sp.]
MMMLIALAAPGALVVATLLSLISPGRRPKWLLHYANAACALAVALAIASAAYVAINGPATSQVVGYRGAGISVRLDSVSCTMFLLVAFIGLFVIKYSASYLDGEERQGKFVGAMAGVLASVQLLVIAGNLGQFVVAWIAASIFLNQLLLFYPNRLMARRAARKKALMARLGDVSLIVAAGILALSFNTFDIATIAQLAHASEASLPLAFAAACLGVSAILKSAQFPTHGWLTEVMETPTPVSALLHAGVVNGGGFLLIRFADVMLLAPGVLAALAIVGGFTALFGGIVMITQPAIKNALAWSTIGQMGFMILQCGLALFPIALLHIVCHSLYKAHAFLASGSAVDDVAALRRPGPVATPSVQVIAKSFLIALIIYAAIGLTLGLSHKSPQSIALGIILILGVAYLLAQGLADAAPRQLTLRTTLFSLGAAVSYFALQAGAEWLTSGTLRAPPAPTALEWSLMILAVLSFGSVALVQTMLPLWGSHPAAAGLRVHLSNGLYANALLDRMLGTWSAGSSTSKA